MNFSNTFYEFSAGTQKQLPASDFPEICFLGRSNVGKSSLINKTLGRKNLAFTGSKPGKTVTVNFYRLDCVRLVDLPGYGYAKAAASEKERWSALCEGYFTSGRNIKAAFQLVDMRHPPSSDDLHMINYLRQSGYVFYIVLTKSDKLNKGEYAKMLKEFTDAFSDCEIITFSAQNGEGVERIRKIIEDVGGQAGC